MAAECNGRANGQRSRQVRWLIHSDSLTSAVALRSIEHEACTQSRKVAILTNPAKVGGGAHLFFVHQLLGTCRTAPLKGELEVSNHEQWFDSSASHPSRMLHMPAICGTKLALRSNPPSGGRSPAICTFGGEEWQERPVICRAAVRRTGGGALCEELLGPS